MEYEEPFNKLIDKVIFHFSSEFKSRVESFRNAETKRDEILGYQYFKAIFALSIEHKASVENGFNDNVTLIVSPEQNQLLLKTIELQVNGFLVLFSFYAIRGRKLMVNHLASNQETGVRFSPSAFRGRMSIGRQSALHAESCRFESGRLQHIKIN